MMDYFKQITIDQIKKNIVGRLGSDACSHADETLNALAYACTFRATRRFADIEMDPQNWNDLADTLTVSELMRVQDSLVRFIPGKNRLFFILGCFARVYGRRVGRVGSRVSDHKERRYTKAELSRMARDLGTLSEADL